MSEYKDWVEQHQDNCDCCHELLTNENLDRGGSNELLEIHLREELAAADAEAQTALDQQREEAA
jgi:hypothetical protein